MIDYIERFTEIWINNLNERVESNYPFSRWRSSSISVFIFSRAQLYISVGPPVVLNSRNIPHKIHFTIISTASISQVLQRRSVFLIWFVRVNPTIGLSIARCVTLTFWAALLLALTFQGHKLQQAEVCQIVKFAFIKFHQFPHTFFLNLDAMLPRSNFSFNLFVIIRVISIYERTDL